MRAKASRCAHQSAGRATPLCAAMQAPVSRVVPLAQRPRGEEAREFRSQDSLALTRQCCLDPEGYRVPATYMSPRSRSLSYDLQGAVGGWRGGPPDRLASTMEGAWPGRADPAVAQLLVGQSASRTVGAEAKHARHFDELVDSGHFMRWDKRARVAASQRLPGTTCELRLDAAGDVQEPPDCRWNPGTTDRVLPGAARAAWSEADSRIAVHRAVGSPPAESLPR
jgi:hypothetical protein